MDEAGASDGVVVRRVLAGEAGAFADLVRRYREDFGRLAVALVGDADAAADALQEAFIRAYERLGTCRDPERFRAWLYRIVANCCHEERRRRAGIPLHTVELPARETADGPAERADLARRLERALATLTPEQREAFVLKEVEGRSYAEIAGLLGVGVDALKMRVYRARDALRAALEEER
jgi:RNA polymerase sigma-70 factor (ECF subfamily)